MRSDMAKVLVERPRWGSGLRGKKKGYRKYLHKTPVDMLPRHEPMIGRWRGRGKHFGEHLSPLKRFLHANVGRPWNKVHQELCERVDFGNVVQKHILTHIFEFVVMNAEVVRGDFIFPEGSRRRFLGCRQQLYVCARTGILRLYHRSAPAPAPNRICQAGDRQFLCRDGAWWEVQVREAPEVIGEQWDVWLEKPIAQVDLEQRQSAYGGNRWAISKRLLSRDETRALLKSVRRAR